MNAKEIKKIEDMKIPNKPFRIICAICGSVCAEGKSEADFNLAQITGDVHLINKRLLKEMVNFELSSDKPDAKIAESFYRLQLDPAKTHEFAKAPGFPYKIYDLNLDEQVNYVCRYCGLRLWKLLTINDINVGLGYAPKLSLAIELMHNKFPIGVENHEMFIANEDVMGFMSPAAIQTELEKPHCEFCGGVVTGEHYYRRSLMGHILYMHWGCHRHLLMELTLWTINKFNPR